jgi:hypothetical protein
MRRRRILASTFCTLLLVGAGCGDDDDAAETGEPPTTAAPEETTTTAAPDDETTTTTSTAPPDDSSVTEVQVRGTEYEFITGTEFPQLEPGLVRFTLTNEGAEEHQASIVRLNDGVTLDQFAAEGGADPTGAAALNLVTGYGGPNAVAPGGTASATASLDAGDYLMICFIPAPDGQPHAVKGMLFPFSVAGTDGPAALPDDELAGEIGTADFAFEVPPDFDGQGTYAVGNDGEQQHEVAVYALDDGASSGDVIDALVEGSGPPPMTPVAGIGPVAGLRGVDAYVELALQPGEYVFLCFLPDVAGEGVPHFVNGMVQQVSVS